MIMNVKFNLHLMKIKILHGIIYFLILITGFGTGIFIGKKETKRMSVKEEKTKLTSFREDSTEIKWPEMFRIIGIRSSNDTSMQKAYFYRAESSKQKPLIVSLHSWSGDYRQEDPLSELCRIEDLNYIHPDFRGLNRSIDACCSNLVISDIDDAITFALKNANVDTSRIFMIGPSGGGYATLAMFMKSKHPIRKFSAWVPISDLVAWYHESRIRGNKYAEDILKCTGSENEVLNEIKAKEKSPIYWVTPNFKIPGTELKIYAGIYDGIQGSVPITQSINFYNKLLTDLSVIEKDKFVSTEEKLALLEYRKPLGEYGKISGRDICLQKEYKGIKLTIFSGNHEILPEFALNELLEK